MSACLALVSAASLRAQQGATAEPAGRVPYSFHHVRIEAGGFITGILFHPTVPGLAYVRTDIGGAYRWDNAAGRWISLSEWIPSSDSNLIGVESMAVDPAHPNDLYLAAGTYTHPGVPNGALLRSHDRGAHFETIPLPFQLGGNEQGRFAGERLSLDPSHAGVIYLGTRNNGLWRSPDYGSTWKPVASFPGKSTNGIGDVFVIWGPKGSAGAAPDVQPAYAGVSTLDGPNLFTSADSGVTWRAVAGAPTGLLPYHAAFTGDGTLYVTYGNAPGPNDVSAGAVWQRSPERDGAHWRNITPEPTTDNPRGFAYAGLALDPHDADIVLVSTLDRWQPGDTLFASHDRGHHWVSLADSAVRDASASPYLIHFGKLPFGHWVGAVALDPFNPNHAMYGTGETLWATEDLGAAWRGEPTHWTVGANGIEETAVISLLAPHRGAPLFAGLGDIGCFRADSVAPEVEATALEPPSLSNCDAVAAAAQNPQHLAMVGRVWTGPSHGGFSLDGGHTWRPFPSEPEGAKNGGSVALSADARHVLWTTGAGVFDSTDNGEHWRPIASCNRPRVFADPHAADRILLLPRGIGELFAASLAPGASSQPRSSSGCQLANGPALLPVAHDLPQGSSFLPDSLQKRIWIYGPHGLSLLEGEASAPRIVVPDAKVSAFGVGAPLRPGGPEALYLAGQIAGKDGIYRSGDDGRSWQHIDDARHQYGYIQPLAADPNVSGRVYLGTNGLGVVVAEPAK